MTQVNLGQTRQSHVSESYTLPECTSKPGYESNFSMEWKWENVCWKWEKKNSLEKISCNKM